MSMGHGVLLIGERWVGMRGWKQMEVGGGGEEEEDVFVG